MDKNDKRDIMAAIIIQSVMIDKLKWLGEHSRNKDEDRLEGLMVDAFRDLVTGTYVLVDEMLAQGADPDLVEAHYTAVSNKAMPAKTAIIAKTSTSSKTETESNTESSKLDLAGAKSDLSPL